MSTQKENVLDRLRRQRAAEGTVDRAEILEDWLKSTNALMSLLGGWLHEAEQEGLFTLEDEMIERTEERLGSYHVPSLKLTSPKGETIRIIPRARLVVGSYGRVDLECPPKKSILVRTEPDTWQFARLVPEAGGWATCLLTEESFWEAIGELIG
jgi:hypothetical protein